MTRSSKRPRHGEAVLLILFVLASLLFLGSIVQTELLDSPSQIEILPVGLTASQRANYAADPLPIEIAAPRVAIVGSIIHDQEPYTDAFARLATVEATLLTPVPSLGLVATRTPTPTRTPTWTPTPSPTAPRVQDPWLPIGQVVVGCHNQVEFPPVRALKIKIQMVGGGGADGRVSVNCCSSRGILWYANQSWQSFLPRFDYITLGEWRETEDLQGALLSRADFSVGCNDKETATFNIYYLPVSTTALPAPTITRVR